MELCFTTLSVTRPKEHVLLVTLNDLAAANAMNTKLCSEIMTLFEAPNRGLNMSLGDGLALEIEAYHSTIRTEDRRNVRGQRRCFPMRWARS
jgi:hypothetical protein